MFITTFRFGSANAQNVTARFSDANGVRTNTFDLTSGLAGDTWYKAGEMEITSASGHYFEIDNSTQSNIGTASNSRMNADAVLFSTIAGDAPVKETKPPAGPDPRDTSPSEIIIDSNPPSLHYDDNGSSGNWATSSLGGYYNGNSRYFAPENFPFDSYAMYLVDLPVRGQWSIDGWVRNNTIFAQGARYRFRDAEGNLVDTAVSQRSNTDDLETGDWFIDVDDRADDQAYELGPGRVYVSVWGNTAGSQFIISDALRFRLIEPPPVDEWVLY